MSRGVGSVRVGLALVFGLARAATAAADPLLGAPDREVARCSIDPTGAQVTLGLEYEGTWSRYQVPGLAHGVHLNSRIPFLAFGQVNILKAKIPYEFDSSGGGLGTVELAAFPVFTPHWGRWGLGPALFLGPREEADHNVQAGPALGLVWASKVVSLGLFSRTLVGPGAAQTILQPVFGITPVDWLNVGLGDPEEVLDFVDGSFTSLPLGVEVSAFLRVGGQHVRFAVNPEYDFAKLQGGPRWQTDFTVEVIVPGTLDVQ